MKKTCFGCRALVWDNGGPWAPRYKCALGFRMEATNGSKVSPGIYNTILTPKEECPKPLTWKQYDKAPLSIKG